MIDNGIKLIEKLIELLDRKQVRKEKYFNEYVVPTYQLAEEVYRDYLQLFADVKMKLKSEDSTEGIIRFLEDGRIKYLPVRAKLRAIVRRRADFKSSESLLDVPIISGEFNDKLPAFERGILGILRGGLVSFEDVPRVNLEPYGERLGHTLLDILYRFYEVPVERNRPGYLRLVEGQIDALKKAWDDVVEGFAQHQKEAIRGL